MNLACDLPPGLTGSPIHLDEAMVVIDKPAGLLAVPGRGPERADCAWARVRRQWPDALVVHRLDQPTSGLLLFGRGPDAQRLLSAAFEQRRVHKTYEAVVAGEPTADAGEIDLPLGPDWESRPRQQVDWHTGRPALTRWTRLAPGPLPGTTRLRLEPVTGRSHQLRVHLAAIGHPIVGDALYAPAPWHEATPRLLLHATALALPHPLTGRPLDLHCAVPF